MSTSPSTQIDLNADLGESFGNYRIANDEAMLDIVSSANIACGFHAGDPLVMSRTVALAAANNVRIGAHPGYRDLAGFGRRNMDYRPEELTAEIIYQIGALDAMARAANSKVKYVKPHGALYNTIARDEVQAQAVFAAIKAVNPELPLMCLAGSPIVTWAQDAGITVIQEAFADRAYNDDGSLVARSQPGAVHSDPAQATAQALAFATKQPIMSRSGKPLEITADSICIHGDNPAALALAQQIYQALEDAHVSVTAQ